MKFNETQTERTSLVSGSVDPKPRGSCSEFSWRLELSLFVLMLGLLNLPLLSGQFDTRFIFLPGAFIRGEWWRVFTHPFVHVSAYHLVLDATAFFMLYAELRDKHRWERAALLLATIAGSLVTAIVAAPEIQSLGLCGLSGVAHGLAAITALDLLTAPANRLLYRLGFFSLLMVAGKSIFEALTGKIAFASLHLGSLGVPIAVCHAGGVLGALLAWFAIRTLKANGSAHRFGVSPGESGIAHPNACAPRAGQNI